jgi:hypothetical protein
MNAAKIQLSEEELQLVQNAAWVLTKNKIIQKVYELFGQLSEDMKTALEDAHLPMGILEVPAKISKGENYNGLPYVMLDYPRFFTNENIFAIRSFFWWGNYFSITLHLKGIYKTLFAGAIQKNKDLLSGKGYHICISGSEWRHELDDDHYLPISSIDAPAFEKICAQHSFLKLSAKIEFHEWNKSGMLFGKLFNTLLEAIKI